LLDKKQYEPKFNLDIEIRTDLYCRYHIPGHKILEINS